MLITATAEIGVMLLAMPKLATVETIGQRIARLRKERGITQAELAQRLQLAQPNVSDYERDVFRLNAELILKLADIFSVSTDELLGRNKQQSPSGVKNRRLLHRIAQIEQLPKKDQQALLRTIDKFLSVG